MKKANIVSFSGGRTSAYLVHCVERMRKAGQLSNVHYIFMDTGAEHPKTYEFIRRCVDHFKINLVCLRPVIDPEIGVGTTYRVVTLEDLKPDLEPWRPMLAKHGTPFNPGGGFCTDRLKTTVSDKYVKDHFGKDAFKWIGYRADESKRAWGVKNYSNLKKMGFDSISAAELMTECLASDSFGPLLFKLTDYDPGLFDGSMEPAKKLLERVRKQKKRGFRFMFEITGFEKQDVLNFWEGMPFDLEIPEWSGNCVFCIKKGETKVALAAKDNPKMADEFEALVDDNTVRDTGRKFGKLIMYRGHNSLRSIREKYKDVSREHLIESLRGGKALDTGSCSDSCEPYSNEMEQDD